MAYLMFLVQHALDTLDEYELQEQRAALERYTALHAAGKCTEAALRRELGLAWLAALAWEARYGVSQ